MGRRCGAPRSTVIANSTTIVGGGIVNGGALTVIGLPSSRTTLCTYGDGGGIYNYGQLVVIHSRLWNNSAGGAGGGLFNESSASTLDGQRKFNRALRRPARIRTLALSTFLPIRSYARTGHQLRGMSSAPPREESEPRRGAGMPEGHTVTLPRERRAATTYARERSDDVAGRARSIRSPRTCSSRRTRRNHDVIGCETVKLPRVAMKLGPIDCVSRQLLGNLVRGASKGCQR